MDGGVPIAELVKRLEGFRMTPSKWQAKVAGIESHPRVPIPST